MHIVNFSAYPTRRILRLLILSIFSLSSGAPVFASKKPSEIRILFPGEYHEDEIDSASLTLNWYGLFEDNGRYYTAKVIIHSERVYDAILDQPNEKSGWKLSIENSHRCVMLVSGIKKIASDNVKTVSLPASIPPGVDVTLGYWDELHLGATGENYSDSTNWNGVANYSLTMSCDGETNCMTPICSKEYFDDAQVSILWCGDLDNDNFPDLLINATHHYNVSAPTLFLSTFAENGLVKEVAKHVKTGC